MKSLIRNRDTEEPTYEFLHELPVGTYCRWTNEEGYWDDGFILPSEHDGTLFAQKVKRSKCKTVILTSGGQYNVVLEKTPIGNAVVNKRILITNQ